MVWSYFRNLIVDPNHESGVFKVDLDTAQRERR